MPNDTLVADTSQGILFILILVVLVVCAAAGALIAQHQRVSTVAGALLGLFLGPIGLIVVALLRPNDPYHG